MRPDDPKRLAAQYVRMSTERQDYSIPLQKAANAAYAVVHDLQIIRTYADERSGLTLSSRAGLKSLIADVVSGRATYRTILVYDVSRWGRFQHPDEAAHYEFLCAEAGVKVLYCAESFQNDGSPASALMKHVKRAMAAEYSRELSAKVSRAQRGLMAQGYWMGGTPPFGFRRLVADQDGNPSNIPDEAIWKKHQGVHTRLTLGPEEEVALIKRVFAMYLRPGATTASIARDLAKAGVITPGRLWTQQAVMRTLKNEAYVGRLVAGRRDCAIGKTWGPSLPRDQWLVVENAFPAIVSVARFNSVQKKINARMKTISREEALADLQRIVEEHGTISQRLINRHGRWGYPVYVDRLGVMRDIRRLLNAPVDPRFAYLARQLHLANDERRARNISYTDDDLLNILRRVLKDHGRLDCKIIEADPFAPTYGTYCYRFGSIFNAYRLIGYQPSPEQERAVQSAQKRLERNPERYARSASRRAKCADRAAAACATRS